MSKAVSRQIVLAPTTFGDSDACKIIASMMNEDLIDIREKHRVCAFLENVKFMFKVTGTVSNHTVKQQLLVLLRNDFLSKIDKMSYPPRFLTHLKTVVTYYCRKNIRGYK
jgi:hypothetical protein